MKNIFIINTHLTYAFSEWKLTNTIIDKMTEQLLSAGHSIKKTNVQEAYDIIEEIEKHTWADIIIVQIPVNWMWVPWIFKKYMDEVYSAGMSGILCAGDGRSRDDATKQYGQWWLLTEKKYMLSLTYNAPREAFNTENQYLMQWKSPDDMFLPVHLNFRFFAMTALETFACYDIFKNSDIENDFIRLREHIKTQIS